MWILEVRCTEQGESQPSNFLDCTKDDCYLKMIITLRRLNEVNGKRESKLQDSWDKAKGYPVITSRERWRKSSLFFLYTLRAVKIKAQVR